jgi:uncharacterized membrane protein YgcG
MPQALSLRVTHSLETLLIEHIRLTNQQLMVAVFSTGPKDSHEQAQEIFKNWKIGQARNGNGVLIAVFGKEKRAQIIVGFGLDSILSPEITKNLLQNWILPDLKRGNFNKSLILGTYHLLEALDSPLIQSGKADEILRTDGMRDTENFSELSLPNDNIFIQSWSKNSWIILLFSGISFILFVFYQLLSREAYFTAAGWHRAFPLRWVQPPSFSSFVKEENLKGKSLELVYPLSPIISAIQRAEIETSLKIRIYLSKKHFEKYPSERTKQLFTHYKMDSKTVFLYINLRVKKVEIVAGEFIENTIKSSKTWNDLTTRVKEDLFQNLRGTEHERAIALTVDTIVQELSKIFPAKEKSLL